MNIRLIGVALLGAAALMGQHRAFEVASVRAAEGNTGVHGGCHGIDSKYGPGEFAPPPLGRCVITNGRLSHLIGTAFQLSLGQIKGATDWMMTGDDRFTVQAKAENPEQTTEKELLEMLQDLLVERFQIKFHRENKDVPGYALVVGKNGPKLEVSHGEESGMNFGAGGKPRLGGPIEIHGKRFR
jgi:uncharacterized protein (TIGR03435 family)